MTHDVCIERLALVISSTRFECNASLEELIGGYSRGVSRAVLVQCESHHTGGSARGLFMMAEELFVPSIFALCGTLNLFLILVDTDSVILPLGTAAHTKALPGQLPLAKF